jgi:putative hemolysin
VTDPSLLVPGSAAPSEAWHASLQLIASLLALGAATTFGTLREALLRSLAGRVLASEPAGPRREQLAGLLERAEPLATSAALVQLTAEAAFVGLLLKFVSSGTTLEWDHLVGVLIIAAPVLLFFSNALPLALARARGDRLLVRALPLWSYLQLPIQPLGFAVDATRRAVQRVLGIADDADSQRRFVEGLRTVMDDVGPAPDIDETARTLIENVMDFRGADAAEVMTPRTEIVAVDVELGLEAALQISLESGHSRVPVFEDSVDSIIGTMLIKDALRALQRIEADRDPETPPLAPDAEQKRQEANLRNILRPPFLVPETKPVADLLKEFRARQQKVAVILDEYGGTAGLVTLTAVLAEIVGEFPDKEDPPEDAIRTLDGGVYEVPAGLHVSEVNESLELDIPEESDFETLGGFVLAQLGHLPKQGEGFLHEGTRYRVLEASDRRVLKISVQPARKA